MEELRKFLGLLQIVYTNPEEIETSDKVDRGIAENYMTML